MVFDLDMCNTDISVADSSGNVMGNFSQCGSEIVFHFTENCDGLNEHDVKELLKIFRKVKDSGLHGLDKKR